MPHTSTAHKVFLTVQNQCLKVVKAMLWVLPFCVWQPVPFPLFMSWRKLAWCVAQVSIILGSNLFLLFTGKEQINMAAPWGTQIWSREKKVCFINADRTAVWSLQMEMLPHFQLNQANFHCHLSSLFTNHSSLFTNHNCHTPFLQTGYHTSGLYHKKCWTSAETILS